MLAALSLTVRVEAEGQAPAYNGCVNSMNIFVDIVLA